MTLLSQVPRKEKSLYNLVLCCRDLLRSSGRPNFLKCLPNCFMINSMELCHHYRANPTFFSMESLSWSQNLHCVTEQIFRTTAWPTASSNSCGHSCADQCFNNYSHTFQLSPSYAHTISEHEIC